MSGQGPYDRLVEPDENHDSKGVAAAVAIDLLRSDRVSTSATRGLARERAVPARLEHAAVGRLLDAGIDGPQRFGDDPATPVRPLEVLADTSDEAHRFDISAPMFDERVTRAKVSGAPHARAIRLRFEQARSLQATGPFDRLIAILEPPREPFARTFGACSDEYLLLLYVLPTGMTHAGRPAASADRLQRGSAGGAFI